MRTAALGDGATLLGRSEHPLRYDPMGDVGLDQPTATAASATSSRMAWLIAVACATERSIPHSSDRRRSLLRRPTWMHEYGRILPIRLPPNRCDFAGLKRPSVMHIAYNPGDSRGS